jgi:nitroimidazol reductase NimA-like FMN-containing flavoprotein (pyridoxamine 5'-phosphate oxidase superfamily)
MEFDPDFTHIRRQDRAIKDEAWIKTFLQRAPYGVLATSMQDQPFIHGILFVYDNEHNVIYLHSANEGRTIDNIRVNPKICFTVAEMGRLLPHPQARGFSVEYSSVVVFGAARLVKEPEEMIKGLHLLMTKYAPHLKSGKNYQPLTEAELEGVAVYCIEIAAWSAKRKQAPEDFDGAYQLEEVISKSG